MYLRQVFGLFAPLSFCQRHNGQCHYLRQSQKLCHRPPAHPTANHQSTIRPFWLLIRLPLIRGQHTGHKPLSISTKSASSSLVNYLLRALHILLEPTQSLTPRRRTLAPQIAYPGELLAVRLILRSPSSQLNAREDVVAFQWVSHNAHKTFSVKPRSSQ